MGSHDEAWESFLDPAILRAKLLSASMYITAFEVLNESIIGRIREFYSSGWGVDGPMVDPKYEEEVLSRNRSPVYASRSWLEEHEAIDTTDRALFEAVKATRNALAHDLHSVVIGGKPSDHVQRFGDLLSLLRKLEVWWVVNVELPCNPDFDGTEVDAEGIVPGPVLSLQMLIEVASGNTELLEHYQRIARGRRKDV